MENTAMTAEHIGRLTRKTGINPISFTHPGKKRLLSAIKPSSGVSRNVIITGTAGAGKTSLCFELYRDLTQKESDGKETLESIELPPGAGAKQLTFIYDISAWRELTGGYLAQSQIEVLTRFARSVFGQGDEIFVIGVNDGQLFEVFNYLPPTAPRELQSLRQEISRLHGGVADDSEYRLRLINLSTISSRLLVELSLDAVLNRPEWRCFDNESSNPLFSPQCSLCRNFKLLQTPTVRSRILTLAEIADAAGYHMPIRGILCMLANALLGNPAAKDGVLRPQSGLEQIIEQSPHEAALHRTLFGEHLGPITRSKREVYRFLSMLQIGAETTNDLDELLIFGAYDQQLELPYSEIVARDPYQQRNPELPVLIREYVRGELSQDDTANLLRELAAERRRLFLTASDDAVAKFRIWHTSVFHHGGDYIEKVLRPLQQGKDVALSLLQRVVAGLNRAWTGLLLTPKPDELYLCTGLDVTTAPVSDILCAQIEITGNGSPGVDIRLSTTNQQPELVIRLAEKSFAFGLTLPRFEFLCRVADGTMPNSFSRESSEDFAMLKQRCIARLAPPANDRVINGIRITQSGKIERAPIHLRPA